MKIIFHALKFRFYCFTSILMPFVYTSLPFSIFIPSCSYILTLQHQRRQQNDMKKLEEQFETDFAVWKREYETTMKLRECERENYIRQQSRAERDRQIESIIAKVDGEALKNQQEFEIKMKYARAILNLTSFFSFFYTRHI